MKWKKLALTGLICALGGMAEAQVIKEHQEMKGPFPTPEAVTKACLECHPKEAEQLFHSRHWQWLGPEFELRGKKIRLGKKNTLNNFCINISTNEPRCTSCHAGYGWKNNKFDHSNRGKMDCLVCHDRTGTYAKFPAGAGYPVYKVESKFFKGNKKTYKKVDLLAVARSTAKPVNRNCGACHFNGGGGHAVKHGDLDKSLVDPPFELDVHMGHPDPAKRLTCSGCHRDGEAHNVRGALHSSMAAGANHFSCTECHPGPEVHKKRMRTTLNMHALTVACETCHIPRIARKHATKTWWDWSTAGDKKRKVKMDENGKPLYTWKKGDFKWKKNFRPEYYWYNGKTDYHLLGEKIADPTQVLTLNPLEGDLKDPKARISPFKVMRGKQFFDKKQKMLLVPHLFGKGGYWKTLNWNKSFTNGMTSVGLTYSGEYDVVETRMFWPIDHMVAPARKALSCAECHPKDGKKPLFDWKRMGYPGDPVKTNISRISQGIVEWK